MATLMNKRKIAAVSRDTPGMRVPRRFSHRTRLNRKWLKNTSPMFLRRSKGGQLKKLSNEFGRKEYRILGALSKLDKFLLNPQTRNCSVVVLGTSRNSNSENREPTGDRSLNDPCPEARFSSHLSGNLKISEVEDYPHMVTEVHEDIHYRPHMVTGIQEEISYCSPRSSSGKQKKARSTSQPQFSVRTPLRQLKQTRFCWHFNNWRRTVNQRISTITSTESRNCPNPSQRQCSHLMENQRNSNCLKICCKHIWTSTTNWQKKSK